MRLSISLTFISTMNSLNTAVQSLLQCSGCPTSNQCKRWAALLQSQQVLNKMPLQFLRTSFPPKQSRAQRSPLCLLWGNVFGTHEQSPPPPGAAQQRYWGCPSPAPTRPGCIGWRSKRGNVPAVVARGGGSALPSGFVCGHEQPWHIAGCPEPCSQHIALIERPTLPRPYLHVCVSVARHGASSLAPSWQREPSTARSRCPLDPKPSRPGPLRAGRLGLAWQQQHTSLSLQPLLYPQRCVSRFYGGPDELCQCHRCTHTLPL